MGELLRKDRYRKILLFCVILASSFRSTWSLGEGVRYRDAVEVELSVGELNRISFAPYNIVSVVGDEVGYKAFKASNGREIYVSSDREAGERFMLSVELASGEIVDLLLEMKEKKSGTLIMIDRKKLEEIRAESVNSRNGGGSRGYTRDDNRGSVELEQRKEIEELFEVMSMGGDGKYYVSSERNRIEIRSSEFNFVATQKKIYRYGELVGIPLEISVSNVGRGRRKKNETVYLSSDDIRRVFANILAIRGADRELLVSGKANVYVVMRRSVD